MQHHDYPHFLNAIDYAIEVLKREAHCYGYCEEQEYTELVALLQEYKEKINTAEKRDYYIWKAKVQRNLSDEDINFFLQNCSRWDLLPVYSLYIQKMSKQEALDLTKKDFNLE